MVNNKNQIYWIIGIVILAVIILPRLDTGLFAVGETCVSNEPNTLEGYKTICDWTIGGESNTKCHLSQGKPSGNDLEIIWGSGIGDVGEGDVVIITKQDIMGGLPTDVEISKRKKLGIEISSFMAPDGRIFNFLCSTKKATYLDETGIQEDYMCLLYVELEIEEKYFSTFYTCEEPQKCYSYLAETCQEVLCSSTSIKFNTLLECQNAYQIIGGCGTVTPGLEDECCQNLDKDFWNVTTLSCESYEEGSWFNKEIYKGFELWMLLSAIGGIILIVIVAKK